MADKKRDLLEALEWLKADESRWIGDPDQCYHGAHESSINIVEHLYTDGADHVYVKLDPEAYRDSSVDSNICALLLVVCIPPIDITLLTIMCTIAELYAYEVTYAEAIGNTTYTVSILWQPREVKE